MAATRRIALTGGIATGKSHVRAQLERLGVPTIDADTLARAAVAPGTPGLAAVRARFGPEVIDASGALDRPALARIVFADAQARRDLEAIVHPAVRRAIDDWFASLDAARVEEGANDATHFAVADIPLLYETGRDREFAAVIVAACEPETQLARVMARDRLSEDEAARRIAAQLPIGEKVRRADYVIRTDGPFSGTNRQVREVVDRIATMQRP